MTAQFQHHVLFYDCQRFIFLSRCSTSFWSLFLAGLRPSYVQTVHFRIKWWMSFMRHVHYDTCFMAQTAFVRHLAWHILLQLISCCTLFALMWSNALVLRKLVIYWSVLPWDFIVFLCNILRWCRLVSAITPRSHPWHLFGSLILYHYDYLGGVL